MTTQEHLWSDIAHIEKMFNLCIDHCRDIVRRRVDNEIDDARFHDLLPSAIHQMELFQDRLYELTVVSKLSI